MESQGISGGLFVVSRLILLIWVTLLLTFTTTPLSLVGGLEYLLKPLEHLKLPAAEIALVMTIALRFIPTLMEESQRIMKAQVSRGVNFDLGGIAHKVRNLAPLVIPLFIGAFRRADEVALAMEARGYRVGVRRTSLKERKTGALDRLSLVCALSVLAVTIFAGL